MAEPNINHRDINNIYTTSLLFYYWSPTYTTPNDSEGGWVDGTTTTYTSGNTQTRTTPQTKTGYKYGTMYYKWTCNGVSYYGREGSITVTGLTAGASNQVNVSFQAYYTSTTTTYRRNRIATYTWNETTKTWVYKDTTYSTTTQNSNTVTITIKTAQWTKYWYTRPYAFRWTGSISQGYVIKENLYASDWRNLAEVARKKACWQQQTQVYGYTVNVWSGKDITASDYNTMAEYCGATNRVNTSTYISAALITALSNAVNNGLS